MAKGVNQKGKLLVLLDILRSETDEEHPMSTADLVRALERNGIPAERKTLYADIAALIDFGYDIVCRRGRSNEYFFGEREFETAEVKLLADAILAARFVSEKKSRKLIRKLSRFISRHEANALNRQVYVQGRTKTENESIYYHVDSLHKAMNENSSIRCCYYEWAVDETKPRRYGRRKRRGGKPYLLSPWALLWDQENYYLVAYDHQAGQLRHYRADKLGEVELLGERRLGEELFQTIDIAGYTRQTFGMFGGQETYITMELANRLVGVVIDRFGREVLIQPVEGRRFRVGVKAVVSPQFFGWVFGLGEDIRILSPPEVAAEYVERLGAVKGQY